MNLHKKKRTWQIFLCFFIFLLVIVSIYFLFHHFKNKPRKIDIKDQENNNFLKKNKTWKQNIDYQPIQPTQREPEFQGKLFPISSVGIEYKNSVIEAGMLPRGSAILTNSGDLERQGIKAIIHACPGTIQRSKIAEFELHSRNYSLSAKLYNFSRKK